MEIQEKFNDLNLDFCNLTKEFEKNDTEGYIFIHGNMKCPPDNCIFTSIRGTNELIANTLFNSCLGNPQLEIIISEVFVNCLKHRKNKKLNKVLIKLIKSIE